MEIARYPGQEPLSENGTRYRDTCLALGADVPPGIEVSLGSHPCQSLLLWPVKDGDGSTLLFLYGGGWTNGYKEMMAFMAPGLNAAGINFVSAGYRLAPEFTFPTGWLDVGRAINWLRQHLPTHGGDPRRIFVGGHSAGGHYASLLAIRQDWRQPMGVGKAAIRGCLPISAIYDFTPGNGMAVRPRFLGPESEANEAPASPLHQITVPTVPFLMAHGARDFPHLVTQAERMEAALAAAGTDVTRLVLPVRDHFEACYAAGDPDGPWLPQAVDWMRAQ
jgi:acetyl esterase/lipase